MLRNKCLVGRLTYVVWTLLSFIAGVGPAIAAGGGGSSGDFAPSFKQIDRICTTDSSSGQTQYPDYTLKRDDFLKAVATQNPDVAWDMAQYLEAGNTKLGLYLWDKISPPPSQNPPKSSADTSLTKAYASIKKYLLDTPLVQRNQQNLETVNFFITDEEIFFIEGGKKGKKRIVPSMYEVLAMLFDSKHSLKPTVHCGTPYPFPKSPPPIAAASEKPSDKWKDPPQPSAATASQKSSDEGKDSHRVDFTTVPAAASSSDPTKPSKSSYIANSISDVSTKALKLIKARSAGIFMVKGADFAADDDANDPSSDNYVYSSDKGLSISMQQTASNARQLNNFTGALGIDLVRAFDPRPGQDDSLAKSYSLVPFVAANRTQAAGKISTSTPNPLPTLTNNTQDWGGVLGVKIPLKSSGGTDDSDTAYLVARLIYDDETDNLLHNKFRTTEARFTPYSDSWFPINIYCRRVDDTCQKLSGLPDISGALFAGNVRALAILDIRAKYIGYYEMENIGAKSIDPRLFKDATRLGGEIGAALAFNFVPNYPLTLSYTYTDYLGLTGFHKDMGLAEYMASLTLNSALPSAPKINFSFDHGRRDDTTVPYLAWTLSISIQL